MLPMIEHMKKQKILLISILSVCMIHIFPGISHAVVGGDCDACHTLYPGMTEKTLRAKPFEYVMREIFCVNCHSNSGGETIKKLGGNRVPVVFNTVKPDRLLAGGNFYYVSKDFSDRKGHNVDGVTTMDIKLKGIPPGYKRSSDPSVKGYNPGKPLACAGSNGCHGNRNIEDPFEAIFGTHHAIDKPIDGSTIARSYRFLKNTDLVTGVTGHEDYEWNQNSSAEKHNEYSPSIDMLCSSCHGDFHRKDKTEKKGPWFRHPTGVALPIDGEYVSYNLYNTDAPVAREIITQSSSDEVMVGRDFVTCLSCHVAHSSPYDSILRWDYDNIMTGEEGKAGCLICHTGKK
jgi:hypothetical protein